MIEVGDRIVVEVSSAITAEETRGALDVNTDETATVREIHEYHIVVERDDGSRWTAGRNCGTWWLIDRERPWESQSPAGGA